MRLSDSIAADWLVDDVLQRHPSTSDIFIQHGPVMRTLPGRLFPEHIKVTLQEYADLKGVSIETLLRHLNAAVEAERYARRNPWMVDKKKIVEVSPGIYAPAVDF
jgi:hypothetical protein